MMYQGIVRFCFYPRVNWSVPEETIFSKHDKISSLEKGNFMRSGKGMKLHLGREGGNSASFLSQKYALSWAQ